MQSSGRWLLSAPPVYTLLLCRMPFIATFDPLQQPLTMGGSLRSRTTLCSADLETGGTGGTLWADSTDGCPCSIPGPPIKMVVVRCSTSSRGDRHRSV
jgi:hypothetical protein